MALDPPTGWEYYKEIQIVDTANVSADYQMELEVWKNNAHLFNRVWSSGTITQTDDSNDNARGVYIDGDYLYAVSNYTQRLVIYDISNPASPSQESLTSTSYRNMCIAKKDDYLFVSNNDGIDVWNVSNPSSPSLEIHHSLGSYVYGIFIDPANPDYLYCCMFANDTFQIIDISNPSSPSNLGSISGSTYFNGCATCYVEGDYAYVANYQTQSGQYGFVVVNISDKNNPTVVTGLGDGHRNSHIIKIDDHCYVGSYDPDRGITVYDVSTPTSPSYVGRFFDDDEKAGLGYWFAQYSADKLFALLGEKQKIFLMDISDPENPKIINNTAVQLMIRSIAIKNNYFYVSGNLFTNFGGYDYRWYIGGWEYTESSSDSVTEGRIVCGNRCENFPEDIRFGITNDPQTATQLAQWIEKRDSSEKVNIWVKCPDDGSNTFYMFVKNSAASEYSSGDDTFIYFDDFTVDDWTYSGTGFWMNTTEGRMYYESGTSSYTYKDLGTEIGSTLGPCAIETLGMRTEDNHQYHARLIIQLGDEADPSANNEISFQLDGHIPASLYIAFWSPSNNDSNYTTSWESEDVKYRRSLRYDTQSLYGEICDLGTNVSCDAWSVTGLQYLLLSVITSLNTPGHNGYLEWIFIRKYAETPPNWDNFGSWTGVGQAYEQLCDDRIYVDDFLYKMPDIVKSESMPLSDSKLMLTSLLKTDTTSLADAILNTISKENADSLNLSDFEKWDMAKLLADSVNLQDSILKDISILFDDTISISDALIKQINIYKSELLNLNDEIEKVIGISLSQILTLSDSLSNLIAIINSNIMNLADAISKTASLPKTETIDLADATLRDISIPKIETINLTDAISRDISIPKEETLNLIDGIAKTISLPKTEIINLSDIIFEKTIAKIFTDALSLTDEIIALITIIKTETISLLDEIQAGLVYSRELSDTTMLSDALIRMPGIIKTENITPQDTIQFATARMLIDTLSLTDALSKLIGTIKTGLITLSDAIGTVAAKAKIFAEDVNLTDSLLKSFATDFADRISIADSYLTQINALRTEIITLLDNISELSIGKVIPESMSLGDILQKSPARVLDQTLSLNDQIRKEQGIEKLESINLADSILKAISTIKSEITSISDVIMKTPSIRQEDALNLQDVKSLQANAVKLETLALLAEMISKVGVVNAETVALTDTIIKELRYILSENINLIDSVTAGILFDKEFSETISLSDLIVTQTKIIIRILKALLEQQKGIKANLEKLEGIKSRLERG